MGMDYGRTYDVTCHNIPPPHAVKSTVKVICMEVAYYTLIVERYACNDSSQD